MFTCTPVSWPWSCHIRISVTLIKLNSASQSRGFDVSRDQMNANVLDAPVRSILRGAVFSGGLRMLTTCPNPLFIKSSGASSSPKADLYRVSMRCRDVTRLRSEDFIIITVWIRPTKESKSLDHLHYELIIEKYHQHCCECEKGAFLPCMSTVRVWD